jgi:uncharacterized Zn-finger protein
MANKLTIHDFLLGSQFGATKIVLDISSYHQPNHYFRADFTDLRGMTENDDDIFMSQGSTPIDNVNATGSSHTTRAAASRHKRKPPIIRRKDKAPPQVTIENLDCHLCEESFSTEYDILNHWKDSHKDERPFLCPKIACGKSFNTKSHLYVHVRNFHLDHKPHVCKFCKHRFLWRCERDKHVRNVHIELKDNECELC